MEQEKQINYEWEPTAKIILTGVEFDRVYNGTKLLLRQALGEVPQFHAHISLNNINATLDEIFLREIKEGTIREKAQEAEVLKSEPLPAKEPESPVVNIPKGQKKK